MSSSVDIQGLDVVIGRFNRLLLNFVDTTDLMDEIGTFLSFSMLDRTSKGKDVEGLPFESYSSSYEELRAAKELPTEVDLFFTGQMLGSLTYEVAKDQVKMFFMDTPRRASGSSKKSSTVLGKGGSDLSNAEVAYYVNEVREFFGIAVEERNAVLKMVEDYIDNAILSRGR